MKRIRHDIQIIKNINFKETELLLYCYYNVPKGELDRLSEKYLFKYHSSNPKIRKYLLFLSIGLNAFFIVRSLIWPSLRMGRRKGAVRP